LGVGAICGEPSQSAAAGLCLSFFSVPRLAAVLLVGLSPRPAVSLPLYARQTGQPCATCHTAYLELTPFGRRFKPDVD
jgi:hypothetical protein